MNTPGIKNLGDVTITGAVTDKVITQACNAQGASQDFIDGLAGMTALDLQVEMKGGSGGSTIDVIVSTSLDQGTNWLDIARFSFVTTPGIKIANLSGLLSKNVASYAALGSEGVLDGVLGDRLRARVTSTGTYTGNTTVSARAVAR